MASDTPADNILRHQRGKRRPTPPRTMSTTTEPTTTLPLSFLQTVADQHGFLTQDEVELLAGREDGRLVQVLVRCGGKRFVCAAQDAHDMIEAVEAAGDYVRDVSLPAGHTLWAFISPLMK